MPEPNAPRTPKPDQASSSQGSSATRKTNKTNARLSSPVLDAGAMTPPPSTQAKAYSKPNSSVSIRREQSLASPPATLKMTPPVTLGSLFGEIPSVESVQDMEEDQLRSLVAELLPAFGEARLNAAHSKLQHSLLTIETEEAAKRAAVEHEATRREIEVWQKGSPIHCNSLSPQSPHASIQRNLHLALAHCRDLQDDNEMLEKRLRSSKKVIAKLDEQNTDLKENIRLLRQRIKDNRDHLNEMQSSGVISIHNTPAVDYDTPLQNHTPRTPTSVSRPSQDPLHALVLAGQVMNGEANSVPPSPHQARTSQARARKLHSGHVRGAHSLSSLPTTPLRSRPVTADNALVRPIEASPGPVALTAVHQRSYREKPSAREDRESTISASDDEEDDSYGGEKLQGSQASQMATDMLRRSLGPQTRNDPKTNQVPESSKLMQTKLFGPISKAASGLNGSSKRGIDDSSEYVTSNSKKVRPGGSANEKIGLGIQA